TAARRRAGTEVLDGQFEKRREALAQCPRAERLLDGAEIFARIALIGAEKQRFLAAEGVVETAALDARVTRDVRERRSTHPLAPELIERNPQDLVVVELTRPQARLLMGPARKVFDMASRTCFRHHVKNILGLM